MLDKNTIPMCKEIKMCLTVNSSMGIIKYRYTFLVVDGSFSPEIKNSRIVPWEEDRIVRMKTVVNVVKIVSDSL